MGEPPWLHDYGNLRVQRNVPKNGEISNIPSDCLWLKIPQKWAINQRQKRQLFSWTTQPKKKYPLVI